MSILYVIVLLKCWPFSVGTLPSIKGDLFSFKMILFRLHLLVCSANSFIDHFAVVRRPCNCILQLSAPFGLGQASLISAEVSFFALYSFLIIFMNVKKIRLRLHPLISAAHRLPDHFAAVRRFRCGILQFSTT